jgi:hypothetical protein
LIRPRSTLTRSTTYNGDIESDPRVIKKSYDNERDQHIDWEVFKQNNGKMLIAHDIVIHEILSHAYPTSFDDIHTILHREFLISEDTINDLIKFLPNSRFVEFEKIDEHCVYPSVYLYPKQAAPTAPFSVFVPQLDRSNEV